MKCSSGRKVPGIDKPEFEDNPCGQILVGFFDKGKSVFLCPVCDSTDKMPRFKLKGT